jgi:hypothetical protein
VTALATLAGRLRAPHPRNLEFGSLHETLLITGVATILVIRTQLWLTNYPQLGGGGLHIAHLLWGGLFMLLAIGLLLTFLGRGVRRAAAIVGGIGFGFFIDELGKFITADNNYFYRPAAALIYLIFLGLFALTRALQRRERLDSPDEVANAVDLLGEAARRGLDERERRQALALLDRASPTEPLVAPLRGVLEQLPVRPTQRPHRLARAVASFRRAMARLTAWSGFERCLAWMFGVWALLSAVGVFELVLSVGLKLGGAHAGFVSDRLGHLAFVNIASLASSLCSAVLVGIGVAQLRRGRRAQAYRNFDRALLVAILVTQVFSFVESQFGAVFGLAVDLVLLAGLRIVRAEVEPEAPHADQLPGRTPEPVPSSPPLGAPPIASRSLRPSASVRRSSP